MGTPGYGVTRGHRHPETWGDTGTPGYGDTGTRGHRLPQDTGAGGHRDVRAPAPRDMGTPGWGGTGTPGGPPWSPPPRHHLQHPPEELRHPRKGQQRRGGLGPLGEQPPDPLLRPPPDLEPPSNCCMSGCANCVWIQHVERLLRHYGDGGERALEAVERHVQDESIKMLLRTEIRLRAKKD
uniref:Oxidoreductase like domain containing 1 n=1 Tax=Anas zonorhyncha TaxID=75864 RepID=A0A8B9U1Q9_9AVES